MKWGWQKIDGDTYRFRETEWSVARTWAHKDQWCVVRDGRWLDCFPVIHEAMAEAERLMDGGQ